MAFISLTSDSRAEAESFVRRFSIPWPCGYGAAPVTPALYVIGPDGRLLWDDGQARPRHRGDCEDLLRELDGEIERALAGEAMLN